MGKDHSNLNSVSDLESPLIRLQSMNIRQGGESSAKSKDAYNNRDLIDDLVDKEGPLPPPKQPETELASQVLTSVV